MNPLTNVKNIQKLNQRELELGNIGKKSWHDDYKDSAWIFVGGLPYTLTEGDILCVFSQYGEIVNINLVRDKSTGKSKGFAFVCYEDQRSTILAVDNLNSIKVLGRTIRVDHVADYKKPKEQANEDEITKQLRLEGCAPGLLQTEAEQSNDQNKSAVKLLENSEKSKKKKKKEKKKKKKKVKVTVKVEHTSESDSSSSSSEEELERKKPKMARNLATLRPVKIEKHDSGYDRALYGHKRDSVSDDRKQEVRTRDTQGSRERNGADASRSGTEHSKERACHGSPEEVVRHSRERHKDWRNHARDEKREHGSCGKDRRRDGEGGSRTLPGSSRDSWDRSSFSKRGCQRDDHSERERHDYDRRDKR